MCIPAMKDIALSTTHLSKHFASNKAVNRVSLTIEKGEIYALVGPNGSGKTTLIKLIVGLLEKTSGSVHIGGIDTASELQKARRLVGYVSDDPRSYGYLTGYEYLVFSGTLHGLLKRQIEKRVRELEGIFPIKHLLPQTMMNYSRGTMQKVALLSALIHEPQVLLIDEPIVGLDPASIDILGALLKTFAAGGGSVLMATHILQFAEDYADRAGIMHEGSIISEFSDSRMKRIQKHFKDILGY